MAAKHTVYLEKHKLEKYQTPVADYFLCPSTLVLSLKERRKCSARCSTTHLYLTVQPETATCLNLCNQWLHISISQNIHQSVIQNNQSETFLLGNREIPFLK